MKFITIFVFAVVAISECGFAMEGQYPELKKLLEKYALPTEYATIIENNKNELSSVTYRITGFTDLIYFSKILPQFIISRDLSDLVNIERANKLIKDYEPTILRVPKAYVYVVDRSLVIFIEKIKSNEKKEFPKLNLEETQQLVRFSEETGFYDWNIGPVYTNIYPSISRDNSGKLMFIQMKDKQFFSDFERLIGHPVRLFYLYPLKKKEDLMTSEAQEWFLNYYTSLKKAYINTSPRGKERPTTQKYSVLESYMDQDKEKNYIELLGSLKELKESPLPLTVWPYLPTKKKPLFVNDYTLNDDIDFEEAKLDWINILDARKGSTFGQKTNEDFLEQFEKQQIAALLPILPPAEKKSLVNDYEFKDRMDIETEKSDWISIRDTVEGDIFSKESTLFSEEPQKKREEKAAWTANMLKSIKWDLLRNFSKKQQDDDYALFAKKFLKDNPVKVEYEALQQKRKKK